MGNSTETGKSGGFIHRHGLWSDDQTRLASEAKARIEAEDIQLIRVAWLDIHGICRARTLTPAAFELALANGYSVGAGSWNLDASGARVINSFEPGGGMDLPELTGSPNLTIVPDPETFCTLPWAPGVAWVMCDDYFRDGTPFFFSPRHLLRRTLSRLSERGIDAVVGLEIEWYLLKLLDENLGEENIGVAGARGVAPRAVPLEPGFSYDSESNLDRLQPLISNLAKNYRELGLGLRSIDNEFGASQIECTFMPCSAWDAALEFALFRNATRQICRRSGHLASFMAYPGQRGLYPSGWHLHLSLTNSHTGQNILMPERTEDALSPLGLSFLAGQLEHACDGLAFATPTINGYRRFRTNSLAPDRATWNVEHRGAMLRIQGGSQDQNTRIENRAGEPGANPYLFIAAQIEAGLDGLDRKIQPWPADDKPYQAKRPMLPNSLSAALDALEGSDLYRAAFGETFIQYFLRMKRAELARFTASLDQTGAEDGGAVTDWETKEYFDAF